MAPKEGDGLGQDILSHSEDFRENWLEYHEDRLLEQRDEFFRTSCHFCGKEFPTALKSFCHERFCKEGLKERFTCKNCEINFKSKEDFKHHGKRHRKPGGYFCFSCDTQFTSPAARIQHRITQHRVYQCQICLIKYKSSADYVRHILITHTEPKTETPKGERSEVISSEDYDEAKHQETFDRDPLVMKIESSTEDLSQISEEAVKDEEVKTLDWDSTAKEEVLEEVIEHDDMDIVEYIYESSDNEINSSDMNQDELKIKGEISSDKRTPHDSSPRKSLPTSFACSRCEKIFNMPQKLITHCRKTHRMQSDDEDWPRDATEFMENRYFCTFCNKKFDVTSFSKHMRRHHGPDGNHRFFCILCERAFRSKGIFERHRMACKVTCSVCNKNFMSKDSLKIHVESHVEDKKHLQGNRIRHVEKPYQCEFCGQSFTKERYRMTHIQFRHKRFSDAKIFSCHICAGTYHVELAFVKHMKNAHGIEMERPSGMHHCNYCKKGNLTKDKLEKHMMKVHYVNGKMQAKCKYCGEYFDDMEAVKEHRLAAHRDKFTCKICDKTFKHEGSLIAHTNLKHTEERTYAQKRFLCGKCGKGFVNKTAHRDHEQSNCGQTPLYQCDICHKFLATQGSLKSHKLIHTDIKAFSCSFCEKSFRNLNHVQRHERTHTGERPYLCTFCPKAFSHKETLNTHLTTHTGIKRYMCSGCEQRFTCISNLQAHRRSHANTCGLVPNCTKVIHPMETFPQDEFVENVQISE